MATESTIRFILIVTLLVIVPGPNGALVLKTVPFQGRQNGIANVLGFFSAFYIHGLFSIFGLSALILSSASAFSTVKTLGALYLAYLGVKCLWSAVKRHQPQQLSSNPLSTKSLPRQTLRSSYVEGFVTNLLNPKTSAFYLAAFPQFVDFSSHSPLSAAGSALALVSIHATINFLWFTGMVFALSHAASWVNSGPIGRLLQGITGGVLLWFGYKLAKARPST